MAKKTWEAGGRLYLVGGCIRDVFLNREINDKDYCVTGLTKSKFENLFPNAKLVGNDFPVYLLHSNEYALAGKGMKNSNDYKSSDINCNQEISIPKDLKQDLGRRDLTINAMAYDIYNNEFIDPYNGFVDLNDNILKSISGAFKNDPLRIYRVARFKAQLEFGISPDTIRSMKTSKEQLSHISIARIFEELKKVLNSDNPDYFFRTLFICNLLDVHFKELEDLVGIPQVEKYHPELFVYNHTIQSLILITKLSNKDYLRFAVLMHDIGKGATDPEDWPYHYQHHKTGLHVLNNFANRITLPNKWYKAARFSINNHIKLMRWRELRPGTLVRLFKVIKRSPLTIKDCIKIVQADRLGRQRNWPQQNLLDLVNPYTKIPSVKNIDTLYYRLFNETGGEDIDSDRYSGKEFGEQLFQYRCQWLKRERKKLFK